MRLLFICYYNLTLKYYHNAYHLRNTLNIAFRLTLLTTYLAGFILIDIFTWSNWSSETLNDFSGITCRTWDDGVFWIWIPCSLYMKTQSPYRLHAVHWILSKFSLSIYYVSSSVKTLKTKWLVKPTLSLLSYSLWSSRRDGQ